jgi:hypothetical protein
MLESILLLKLSKLDSKLEIASLLEMLWYHSIRQLGMEGEEEIAGRFVTV